VNGRLRAASVDPALTVAVAERMVYTILEAPWEESLTTYCP
jgi:hypothetical protein